MSFRRRATAKRAGARRLLLSPPSCQGSADHQLDLIEQHQRQHDQPKGLAGEQHARQGQSAGEALLEPPKTMAMWCGTIEAEKRGLPAPVATNTAPKERRVQQQRCAELGGVELVPDAVRHALAERDIHDQQNEVRRPHKP